MLKIRNGTNKTINNEIVISSMLEPPLMHSIVSQSVLILAPSVDLLEILLCTKFNIRRNPSKNVIIVATKLQITKFLFDSKVKIFICVYYGVGSSGVIMASNGTAPLTYLKIFAYLSRP
jgi:hypothetical protein